MESNSSSSIVDDVLVGSSDKFFLSSAATTPKTKKVKNDLVYGSPLGSLDYDMDNNDGDFLSPLLGISLKKKWLDPKIVKTQVEVAVKKSFALDINLSTVEGKLAMAKTQISIEKATSLAKKERITVNTDLKKQGIRSDQAIVIKEIPMDTPKGMIIAALSEFGQVQKTVMEFAELSQADLLAAKWSFLIRKDSVCMAKAVGDRVTWASRDQFRVLLFTLPVGTTAHDLGNLLEKAGGKTCVINWSLESGNRTRCTVVGFESDKMLESAFCTTKLGLVWCDRCGKLGHSVLECDAEIASTSKPPKSFIRWVTLDENHFQLAKLYVKKSVLISCLAAFGGKSWTQVIFSVSISSGLSVGSDSSLSFSGSPGSGGLSPSTFLLNSALNECLLVPLVSVSNETPAMSVSQPLTSVLSVVANSNFLSNMVLNSPDSLSNTPLPIATNDPVLGLSSFKVLTSKLSSLESKFVALEVLLIWKKSYVKQFLESAKTIDYVFVSSNLVNVISDHGVVGIEEFFDTNYKAVFVSVSLGSLLDVQLNALHKQANKDYWKYNFKGADNALWPKFKDKTAANTAMIYDNFLNAKMCSDLDAM
ncbi:hypothetical protein G9A89_022837 [Geosiphon pyriformis]|nr:hypothetical protein G9A89_022837 [Geosiphon pyriformis]